jgi:serine/threonine-protein kinase HipA
MRTLAVELHRSAGDPLTVGPLAGQDRRVFTDDQTGDWSLSPAYGLPCSSGPGGEHSSNVLGEGRRPLRSHCLKLAEQFGLKPRETGPIMDQVSAAVSRWPAFAEEAGCPKKTVAAIGAWFDLG